MIFLTETGGIKFFGLQHFLIIFIMIGLCVWFPLFARRRLNPDQQLWVLRGLSILVCAGILSSVIFRMAVGSFDWRENLPLNVCNLFALILPVLFWRRPPKHLIEVFYYLIVAGTGQAVLTPDLTEAFPHLLFISYWIVHCGLILHIVYVIVIWRIKPRKIGILYSLLWINVYALIIMIFNYFIGANYMYMMEKPPAGSLLDFLGPWPWYILAAQPLGLLLFWLAWLPFARCRFALSVRQALSRRRSVH